MSHITVCICTYRRPQQLQKLLCGIEQQITEGLFTFSVAVVDNDKDATAREVVEAWRNRTSITTEYDVEPERSIARARNRAVASAGGDYIAFVDDDEAPVKTWLLDLLVTCSTYNCDGVLGPVKPLFAEAVPQWVKEGDFFERRDFETGHPIGLADARTGNVLLKRALLCCGEDPFDNRFATGGEDVDFFRRKIEEGRRFIWCKDAVVYETVPLSRCTRAYLLRRALLRGSNTFRQPAGRPRKLLKSALALPAYMVSLPFLTLSGHRRFMNVLIRACDHAGRLLASIGVYPVKSRDP